MTFSPYELRLGTAEGDWESMLTVLRTAFNDDDFEVGEAEKAVFEPERTVFAVAGDTVAGVSSVFTRDMVVPGGIVPTAHVTQVSVLPTHRRQGLLRRMITRLHTDALALGEPIAALWASEGKIYQRFGYGLAALKLTIEAEQREMTLRDPVTPAEGRLRDVPVDSPGEMRKVYDEVYADRPGWSVRDDRSWALALLDPKSRRGGATALRATVHDGPDGVDGYVLWRVKNDWSGHGPVGTVQIRELIASTPEAYRALWHFALRVDLTRKTRYGLAAVDEPVQYLVDEPRRLQTSVNDSLWVRILDVPKALTARRYAAPVDVVIEVTDADLPDNAGRWHLVGDRDGATCTRADRPADLSCDVHALGAVYLGGTPLAALAAGGQVRELRAGMLAPASVAFGWHRAPSATEGF